LFISNHVYIGVAEKNGIMISVHGNDKTISMKPGYATFPLSREYAIVVDDK
jgi:hypothetical protein